MDNKSKIISWIAIGVAVVALVFSLSLVINSSNSSAQTGLFRDILKLFGFDDGGHNQQGCVITINGQQGAPIKGQTEAQCKNRYDACTQIPDTTCSGHFRGDGKHTDWP